MRLLLIAAAVSLMPSFASAVDGMIVLDSTGTVSETADRLEALVEAGPPKMVARVDHQANAASVQTEIPATTLVIFGNPALGTPIIAADPRTALDLPVRVLIWDAGGVTKMGYLDPQALKARYQVTGADAAFETMAAALKMLTQKAAAK